MDSFRSLRVLLAGPPGDRLLALRDTVNRAHGLTVCAEAADGAAALRIALEQRPDLCLAPDDPQRFDAVAFAQTFAQRAPRVRVVLVGPPPDDARLLDAVAAGASGYLPCGLDAERLAAALFDAVSGRPAFPRRLGRLLIAGLREDLGEDLGAA